MKRKTIPAELAITRMMNRIDSGLKAATNLDNSGLDHLAEKWRFAARSQELAMFELISWVLNDDPCHIYNYVKCPENTGTFQHAIEVYKQFKAEQTAA